MTSTFTSDGATGGQFMTEAGTYAIAQSAVTTASPDVEVSYRFLITRRPLYLRVGTTAGEQDILNDLEMKPGVHVVSFTPNDAAYFIEFQLREVGQASLSNFYALPTGALALSTPWFDDDLRTLRSEIEGLTQWWCHPSYQTRVLERRGPGNWSLRLFQPKDGPFEPNDPRDVTMTPSVRTGTATVTASRPVFKTTDAGSLIRLTQAGQYETMTGAVLDDQTDAIRVSGTGASRNFYYSVSGTFSATVLLERSVGNEVSWLTVATITTPTSTSLNDALDGQIV